MPAVIKLIAMFLLKAFATGFCLATGFAIAGFIWGRTGFLWNSWFNDKKLFWTYIENQLKDFDLPTDIVPEEFRNMEPHLPARDTVTT